MKKCCFIIPYFGKLPNYFQLFLKSCEYNPTFNWIVFTDDKTGFHYPDNVKRVEMTFLKLRDLVQSKFDFPISLERPYKLCDYKPAYGYIFSDFISGYKMWGHCDIDTLMGHLEDFITDRDIAIYDKMFTLGHMIIYKNTEENNRLFMKDFRGVSLYRESFTTDKITSSLFSNKHSEKAPCNTEKAISGYIADKPYILLNSDVAETIDSKSIFST